MQTVRTNIMNNASTQYTNFDYNSLCRFNGKILGAGDAGLFEACCGADDNGTDIDAYFTPLTSNLGKSSKKSVRYVYLGYQTDGVMNIYITGDEEVTAGPYAVIADAYEGQQRRRRKIGRGMTWVYGRVKVSNTDGCDFSVDSIELYIQSGRIG